MDKIAHVPTYVDGPDRPSQACKVLNSIFVNLTSHPKRNVERFSKLHSKMPVGAGYKPTHRYKACDTKTPVGARYKPAQVYVTSDRTSNLCFHIKPVVPHRRMKTSLFSDNSSIRPGKKSEKRSEC